MNNNMNEESNMKYIKRILSFLLAVVLIVSTFSACSTLNLNNVEGAITKGEWIETLGRYFGMDSYQNEDSYFVDINQDDSYFPYVQSCCEWGVIPKSEYFNADDKVTKEYAFATCIYGLGDDKTDINLNNSEIKEAANYAYKYNIAKSNSWLYMHEGVTIAEAEEILESTLVFLSGYAFPSYNNSKYSNKVKVCSDSEDYSILYGGKTVEFPSESAYSKYNPGDVIILKNNGIDTPTKIKDIRISDGKTIIETEIPQIEEIYETIDFSATSTIVDPSQIVVYDGFTLDSFNGSAVTQTNNRMETPNVEPLGIADNQQDNIEKTAWGDFNEENKFEKADISFGVSIKNGKPALVASKGSASGKFAYDPNGNKILFDELAELADLNSIPDEKVEDVKKLADPKWIKGSYEITGKIDINNFYVQAKAKGNVFNLKNIDASVETNMEVSTSIEFKGKVSVDKNIGKIPIQLGATPFKINITLALVGELGGSLTIKWSVSNNCLVEYNKGNIKKSNTNTATNTVELKGKLEVGVGPRVHLAIGVLTFDIDLLNFTLTIGGSFSASVKWANLIMGADGILYKKGGDENSPDLLKYGIQLKEVSMICTETELEFPIIKLSFCDDSNTLLSKFSVSFDTVLVGKKGLKKIDTHKHHYEYGKEVGKCLIDNLKQYHMTDDLDSKEDTEVSNAEATSNSMVNALGFQIDTYAVDVKLGKSSIINIVSLPDGMSNNDVSVKVNDSNIAKAELRNSQINITGLEEGTTTIIVTCGNTQLQCMVMVSE